MFKRLSVATFGIESCVRWLAAVSRNGFAAALVVTLTTVAGVAVSSGAAEAKTPGKTYCYKKICHRVKTIREMVALVGRDEKLVATHYDDCKRDRYNPCGLTSSGEAFRADSPDNAASPIYPNGTVLLIRNPETGQSAVVRVNNSGPYWGNRKLDVSRATADRLGFRRRGVATLDVRVVSAPTLAETRYKKNRRYAAVPGAIGRYASLNQAQGGMMVAMALDAMSGSVFAPAAGKMLPSLKTATPALANMFRSHVELPIAKARPATDTGVRVATRAQTPAEGLKAAARELYGVEDVAPIKAPSSLLAERLDGSFIAPIHRSRVTPALISPKPTVL